jgi:hypothetical protein
MYSDTRKKSLIDVCSKGGFCIVEDDPYSELYFDARDKTKILPHKAMAPKEMSICYIGSFAKIFGPGLRLGWLLGPRAIVEKCELAKQSMDACSSSLSQVLAHAYLSKGKLPGFLESIRPRYARRAGTMLDALSQSMPTGVTWTQPKGGFYIWVTLPESMNATEVFNESIKKPAAFVVGNAFDPHGVRNNCFRLAFSHTPEDKITEGIGIIAEAVKRLIE